MNSVPTTRAPTHDEVESAFGERYAEVQYAFVQFLSEHLADCARTFNGDLAAMLVLAVIGQSHIAAVRAQPDTRQGALDYGISALRIADVAGLPRETVRRKLARLAEKGWVVHGPKGWRIAADGDDVKARNDLAQIDRRGLARLARLHTDLSRLLGKRQ